MLALVIFPVVLPEGIFHDVLVKGKVPPPGGGLWLKVIFAVPLVGTNVTSAASCQAASAALASVISSGLKLPKL